MLLNVVSNACLVPCLHRAPYQIPITEQLETHHSMLLKGMPMEVNVAYGNPMNHHGWSLRLFDQHQLTKHALDPTLCQGLCEWGLDQLWWGWQVCQQMISNCTLELDTTEATPYPCVSLNFFNYKADVDNSNPTPDQGPQWARWVSVCDKFNKP